MNEKMNLNLVKKAIRGNPDAYGELIITHQNYLYKMAFLYMKNEQDALDLVGTVILKGYQNIRKLKNPEWFRTWITRILINTAKDIQKKIIYFDEIDSTSVADQQHGITSEEKLDLTAAITQLPEKYRSVIILKYFSGMSVKEIACIMSIPEGTVKAYLNRARGQLKKLLKEDYFYED